VGSQVIFLTLLGIIRITGWRSLEECGEPGMVFHIVRDLSDHVAEILGGMWGARYDLFNIARDNPDHGAEILGGMWGARYDIFNIVRDHPDHGAEILVGI
jgi:hypothetical protein